MTNLSDALAQLRGRLADRVRFADTTVAQRTWNAHGGGWSTDARCPRCGREVVYNGNYFCEDFDAGGCRWALEHPATDPGDRRVCDVVGITYD